MDAERDGAPSPSSATSTAPRPPGGRAYLPPGSPRAALDQPAWVRLDDGRRVLELPTHALARQRRPRARRLAAAGRARPLPRLRAARRAAAGGARRSRCALLARRRRPVELGALDGRPRGRVGRRMRRLIAARGARRALLAGCGSGAGATRGLACEVDKSPFRVTIVRRRQDGRRREQGRAPPLPAGVERRAAHADEGHLLAHDAAATSTRSRPTSPAARRRSRSRRTRAGVQHLASRSTPRPTCSRSTTPSRPRPTSTSSAAASAATASTCAARSCRSKVAYQCTLRADPVLRELGRLGRCGSPAARSPALAFPGSPGGTGCQVGDGARARFPALADRAEVCVLGARLDEDLYVGSLAADARRLRGRDRPAARRRRRRSSR